MRYFIVHLYKQVFFFLTKWEKENGIVVVVVSFKSRFVKKKSNKFPNDRWVEI